MIIDLNRFLDEERPYWDDLEGLLEHLDRDLAARLSLDDAYRLHYLYRRASADLGKISTFSAEPQIRTYLEDLVGRAYAQIHHTSGNTIRFKPIHWLRATFPRAFRRHVRAFRLVVVITLIGCAFGGAAVGLDPDAKRVLMPFRHLQADPAERVGLEEERGRDHDRMEGARTAFAAQLMTHNTRVSILAMGLGMTFGIGTIVVLFSNGVMLGAVCVDYIMAGQTTFLAGWLLPHGSIEIPAILIAAQAGLVLASALPGRGSRQRLYLRLRAVAPDVMTLIFGVALMLVWAGVVESFFSQYHAPVIPYGVKIGFGLGECCLLAAYLTWSGRESDAAVPEGV